MLVVSYSFDTFFSDICNASPLTHHSLPLFFPLSISLFLPLSVSLPLSLSLSLSFPLSLMLLHNSCILKTLSPPRRAWSAPAPLSSTSRKWVRTFLTCRGAAPRPLSPKMWREKSSMTRTWTSVLWRSRNITKADSANLRINQPKARNIIITIITTTTKGTRSLRMTRNLLPPQRNGMKTSFMSLMEVHPNGSLGKVCFTLVLVWVESWAKLYWAADTTLPPLLLRGN